jgi:excinuclease ABC subunit A
MDIVLNGSREVLKYSITTRSGNVMHRNGFIEGVKRKIERLYVETTSQMMRDIYGYYMREIECPKCHGNRLNEAALSVKLGKYNIMELCSLSVEKIHKCISELKLTEQEASIGNLAIKEIKHRLEFLINLF